MSLHGTATVDTPAQAADAGRQWGQILFARPWPHSSTWLIWSDVPASPGLTPGWEVWDSIDCIAAVRPGGLVHPAPEAVASAAYPHIVARIPARP